MSLSRACTQCARLGLWDTLAVRFRAHAGDTEHLYGYAMRGRRRALSHPLSHWVAGAVAYPRCGHTIIVLGAVERRINRC
jgi:hypothetical protein